jgi:hypothetical protein
MTFARNLHSLDPRGSSSPCCYYGHLSGDRVPDLEQHPLDALLDVAAGGIPSLSELFLLGRQQSFKNRSY